MCTQRTQFWRDNSNKNMHMRPLNFLNQHKDYIFDIFLGYFELNKRTRLNGKYLFRMPNTEMSLVVFKHADIILLVL